MFARLTVVFLVCFLVFFIFRDVWFPQAQSAYKATIPYISRPQQEQEKGAEDVQEPTSSAHDEEPSEDGYETCRHLPGAGEVLVLLKTGATELYEKLPTHFVTTFKCVPNFMIFSDLNQTFGDIPIYDAIAPVSEAVRENHEDFALYRDIGQWQREGQDVSKLKGGSGWNLDRWKFLPMLFQAFETADEEIEWFVMIEADTSISWLNLLLYLETMDSSEAYYLGAQNQLGDTTFAHGGSGIVISRAAADKLSAHRYNTGKETYDSAWETSTAASCCGDAIVAEAFLEAGVPLSPAWPLIQGEEISTVDFTGHHWCAPPITWHHVTPIEVDTYWQFEKSWTEQHDWETPYLYRDIFAHFVEPFVFSTKSRPRWNNLSKDTMLVSPGLATSQNADFYSLEKYEQEAVESEEACAEACLKKEEECIQWMFQPGRCYLGRDIRFGKSDDRESEHWTSGWMKDRVRAFKERFEGCKEIKWSK